MSYTLEPSNAKFCSTNLDQLSVHQREQHYEKHLNNEPIGTSTLRPARNRPTRDRWSTPKTPRTPSSRRSFNWKDWMVHVPKGQDKFWYPAQTLPPPQNFTPGLIPLLKTHLNKSHAGGNTRRAVLCHDRAVLVTREIWDASWGCGYRNFLMACTSLMDQQFQPMYFPLLDDPIAPSVRNLQLWLESAWKEGFDPEGARQLRPLVGSKKWIGTSDVQIAFTSRGIPSKLVDFDLKTNSRGAALLTDWVVEYFSEPYGMVDTRSVIKNPQPKTINDALRGASPVTVTSRMPLILQHQGHSRTIVGYEVSKTGLVNLLEFDPSKIPKKSLRQAGLDAFSSMPPRHSTPLDQTTNAVASTSTKRPATAMSNPLPLKRSRVDNRGGNLQPEEDDDVVIIEDPRNENLPGCGKMLKKKSDDEKPSTRDVLQFFRLDPKKLEKKKAYQVLYFPLSAPLDEAERRRARDTNGIFGEKIS
ncbi:peptidase family C78-domain-containing protein [Mycena olivaceomarginata]|nr:peptidase family C78-domain-containing protein [Mycena olivaceomarginata]